MLIKTPAIVHWNTFTKFCHGTIISACGTNLAFGKSHSLKFFPKTWAKLKFVRCRLEVTPKPWKGETWRKELFQDRILSWDGERRWVILRNYLVMRPVCLKRSILVLGALSLGLTQRDSLMLVLRRAQMCPHHAMQWGNEASRHHRRHEWAMVLIWG